MSDFWPSIQQIHFQKKYMKWIGHYEFGANLRPIDFCGELTPSFRNENLDQNFWMSYWSTAYKYCLRENLPHVHFVDFDDLIQNGAHALARIGEAINLSDLERLTRGGHNLRTPPTAPIKVQEIIPDVWKEAQIIYDELRQRRL